MRRWRPSRVHSHRVQFPCPIGHKELPSGGRVFHRGPSWGQSEVGGAQCALSTRRGAHLRSTQSAPPVSSQMLDRPLGKDVPFTFQMKIPITASTSDSSWSPKTKVGHASPGGTILFPEEANFLLPDLGVRTDMGNRDPEGQTTSSKCQQAGGGKRCRKIPSWKVQLGFYVDPNLGGRTTEEMEPGQALGVGGAATWRTLVPGLWVRRTWLQISALRTWADSLLSLRGSCFSICKMRTRITPAL